MEIQLAEVFSEKVYAFNCPACMKKGLLLNNPRLVDIFCTFCGMRCTLDWEKCDGL